jgi:hypothetical protein
MQGTRKAAGRLVRVLETQPLDAAGWASGGRLAVHLYNPHAIIASRAGEVIGWAHQLVVCAS